jgi:plastin-1
VKTLRLQTKNSLWVISRKYFNFVDFRKKNYEFKLNFKIALVWQAMRFFILNYLKNMSKSGQQVTEQDIIDWANRKVKESGKSTGMDSFKDKSLSDSLFIIDLLAACRAASVDYNLVKGGKSDEEKMLNAQYAIS